MLHPPGFYYVKKPKRFVISSSDKSSECNLSSFFDIKKLRRIEHLQSEELFSSDPYFSTKCIQLLMNKIKILYPLCGLTAALLQLANLIIFDDSNLASCATLKAKTPFPKQLCRSWPRQSQRKIFFDLGFPTMYVLHF